MNENSTNMKMLAAAQGADVDLNEDWFDPQPESVLDSDSIRYVPFGLGYEGD
jgi:hypothetical protein